MHTFRKARVATLLLSWSSRLLVWSGLKFGIHVNYRDRKKSYVPDKGDCCIFWPAFGCCALQPLVKIVIFSVFAAKNLKKARNFNKFAANFSKKHFFKLQQNAGGLFYSQKMSFFSLKTRFYPKKTKVLHQNYIK